MKSPQTEDGYTRIANELQDAFCKVDLSGSAWRCLSVIIRKTYGFQKKKDSISLTQFEELTGMTRMGVAKGLNELEKNKMIYRCRDGYITSYSLNKNYEEWGSIQNDTSIQLYTKTSIQNDTKTSIQLYTHKRKKENKYISDKSQKDMSFKNMRRYRGEEGGYEEVAVQTDPDYKPKKKTEKKVSEDIQAVFDLFNNPASALWRMREIERVAAQTLFDTYGLEKLKIRIDRIEKEKGNKDPLFPLITTPSQLLDKMPNVERYLNV